jgi:hypothetical protein
MSFSKHSRNPPKPKYCKVCHDAGKDEKSYTSHYIRETPEPSSRIVCPTLLALECKYCYKNGHTVKYCNTLKKNKALLERRTKDATQTPKVATSITPRKSENQFALLDCDDEEETETIPVCVPIQSQAAALAPAMSWQKIIDVTNQQVIDEENDRLRREDIKRQEERRKREEDNMRHLLVPTPAPRPTFFRSSMINWADDTSDEEDEDM